MQAGSTSAGAPLWRNPHRVVGFFALFVWLHALFLLYPLPQERAARLLPDAPMDVVLPDLWRTWIEGLILLVVGITVSVMAYRDFRFWKPAILLSSGFVALENLTSIVSDILSRDSLSYWLQLWATVTGNMIDRGQMSTALSTLYQLFVWPAYHLLLVGAVIAVWFFQRRALRANSQHDRPGR